MATKKPYELVDGDVIDMTPVFEQLEELGVEISESDKLSAQFVYWVVQGTPTPWALREGKRVNVAGDTAFGGIDVFFENGEVWTFPGCINFEVDND